MIKQNSEEWSNLLEKFKYSISKSNRDVLCGACWKILKYEEYVKHKIFLPNHQDLIFTSKKFASEQKFIEIAKKLGKIIIDPTDNSVVFFDPYTKPNKCGRPSRNFFPYSDFQRNLHHQMDLENIQSWPTQGTNQYYCIIAKNKILMYQQLSNQKIVNKNYQEIQNYLNNKYSKLIDDLNQTIIALQKENRSLQDQLSNQSSDHPNIQNLDFKQNNLQLNKEKSTSNNNIHFSLNETNQNKLLKLPLCSHDKTYNINDSLNQSKIQTFPCNPNYQHITAKWEQGQQQKLFRLKKLEDSGQFSMQHYNNLDQNDKSNDDQSNNSLEEIKAPIKSDENIDKVSDKMNSSSQKLINIQQKLSIQSDLKKHQSINLIQNQQISQAPCQQLNSVESIFNNNTDLKCQLNATCGIKYKIQQNQRYPSILKFNQQLIDKIEQPSIILPDSQINQLKPHLRRNDNFAIFNNSNKSKFPQQSTVVDLLSRQKMNYDNVQQSIQINDNTVQKTQIYLIQGRLCIQD